ncbi:FtsX-like permease family protein [Plantactinospora sp. GCM10030261]|uniref:FtsX-like permease family protein n=1 Tax=Plantactinospora sp. GCM10030261 TaxID=3273420 RepID=UPI00360A9A53
MRLVLRRAREARGLLLAAAVAALVSTALVTGLADYNRQVTTAGQRGVTAAAPAAERSILVSGSVGLGGSDFAARDAAVRAGVSDGLAGIPSSVTAARYGTGRQLLGDLKGAPTDNEPVFIAVATLDELPEHADLTAGAWPRSRPADRDGQWTGGAALEVALPGRTADLLGVTIGDRIPLRDRAAQRDSQVVVAGIWRPRNATDAYWRLAPGGGGGGGGSAETLLGPLVLAADDFDATFAAETVTANWLAVPDLGEVGRTQLTALPRAVAGLVGRLPEQTGLGSSGRVDTGLDRLADRLGRTGLVGRSALLTPVLLVVVLGGYALVLIAALLHEDRRGQTALLRARGAARRQLAGLTAREAALVVLPGLLLAPPLVGVALRALDASSVGSALPLDPALTPYTWFIAAGTTVGCLLVLLEPALRSGGTYAADLAARSRPARWAAAQRAGVDLALVGAAVLAWWQLREYGSPLVGSGAGAGIDPLLAAAPTLGVLAGAVIALRVLPPATRLAERVVDRRPWTATVLGTWHAGRRPHAGPVLLLALAVGASTLSWSLLASWQRSLADQASHRVGADLRLVSAPGSTVDATDPAGLPGVRAAVPAWQDNFRLGRENLDVSVLALDAAAAPGVVRLDERLVDGTPDGTFRKLVEARPAVPGVPLPADARRLSGTLRTPVTRSAQRQPVTTTALVADAGGTVHRLPLARSGIDGRSKSFNADLPDSGGRELRLIGFDVDAGLVDARRSGRSDSLEAEYAGEQMRYGWRLTGLRAIGADGTGRPVRLESGNWLRYEGGKPSGPLAPSPDGLSTDREVTGFPGSYYTKQYVRFTALREAPATPVPALVTPRVLDSLSGRVGDIVEVQLSGFTVPVVIVGVTAAVPSVDQNPAAMLLDLPSVVTWQLRGTGSTRAPDQWWLATDPVRHAEAAEAAAGLPGAVVYDRVAATGAANRDPYWQGARMGLLAAAGGAVLLAIVGLVVDVWATARRRTGELAVLHILGATPRLLARALLAEQAFLAGAGVVVGLLVGVGVAATMAPLVILTPTGDRPVIEPAFELPWGPAGAAAGGLLAVALLLGVLIAGPIGRRVAAAQLRVGGDR